MATQIGALAKHTGWYGLGTMVGGVARAVMVPIIARYVPTAEYGKASVVLILVTLLAIVSELGLSSSLIKFVNEARTDEERKRAVSTILVGSLAIAVPLAIVAALCFVELSRLLLGSADYGTLILIGIIGGLGNAMLQVGLAFERAFAKSFRYFLYTLAKGVLSLVLSITLVVVLRRGAMGLLLGAALPPFLIGVGVYAGLFRRLGAAFSRATLRSVFEFGGPLVPMNLAMWVLGSSDIYLLRRFAATPQALSEVGLYQYAHEICLVLVLPVTALNLAWPQFLFSNYMKPEGRDLFARVHSYFSFFLVETAFLMAVFAGQIVRLVGTSGYAGSAGVIPMLAGSLLFYGFSIIFASGLYVTGRTRLLASIVGACALLNVVLNILLIPKLGKQGAAFATMITNLVMMLTVLAFAQARFRIPFRIRPAYAGIVLAGGLVAGLALLSRSHPALAGFLPRLATSCGFSVALFAILGMRPRDAAAIVRTLASVARPEPPPGG